MDYRKLRLWVYAVIVSAGPVVSFYGLMSTEEVALWLGVGATVLGVPAGTLAIANLEPKPTKTIVEETVVIEEEPESSE